VTGLVSSLRTLLQASISEAVGWLAKATVDIAEGEGGEENVIRAPGPGVIVTGPEQDVLMFPVESLACR
jgi:hypothetical protein